MLDDAQAVVLGSDDSGAAGRLDADGSSLDAARGAGLLAFLRAAALAVGLGGLSHEARYTVNTAAAIAVLACAGCILCECCRSCAQLCGGKGGGKSSRYAPPSVELEGAASRRQTGWGRSLARGGRRVPARPPSEDDEDDEDEEYDEESIDIHKAVAFDEAFKAERQAAGRAAEDDLEACLGVPVLPAIYKTAEGASTIDIPLAGLASVSALVDAVAHVGSQMIDAEISTETIKVHYARGEGKKPRKITPAIRPEDLRQASALLILPRDD